MWVYALLLLLPALCWWAERYGGRIRTAGYVVIFVALVGFLGLRHQIGCDWNNYLLMFRRAQSYDFPQVLAVSDPGHMLIGWAVARLGFGFGIFNAVLALIFAAGLVAFVRRQQSPALALLVATPVLVAIVGLGVPRQAVAVSLLMLAASAFVSGRRRLPAALIAASILFHWTALILLPLTALMLVKRRVGPHWLIGLAAAAALLLFAASLFVPTLAMMRLLEPAQGGIYRAVPGILALAAYFLLVRRRLPEEELRIHDYLAAVTLFAAAMIWLSPTITDRLGFYGIPFQMMVFSRLPKHFSIGWQRVAAVLAVISLYAGLFSGWLLLTTHKHCFAPYSSYLTKPHLLFNREPEPQWVPCGWLGDETC